MSLYSNGSGPFYDEFENLSGSHKEQFLRARLDNIIKLAATTTNFFQDRLKGYKPSDEFPLLNVPILMAEDLRQNLPPKNNTLVSTDENKGYNVFQSGGTTGEAKTSLFSYTEMEHINFLNARGFFATGLTPEDRTANFWAVGGLYMTFVHMNRMLMEYGCVNFPFSNHTAADFAFNIVKSFDINCFTGISSVVLNNLRQMYDLAHAENVELKIGKVYYGGEHFYQADREELYDKFGTTKILAPGYGTVDTWYIGYQCEHTPPGYFHTHEDHCYVEIYNEENSQPSENGEIGMLYATPLTRTLTPIIRYSVGDRARWIGEDCPCGRKTKVFELLGRGDDILRIGYDSVDYGHIQTTVNKIERLTGTIQIEKKRKSGRDLLIVRIETEIDPCEYDGKKNEFGDLFLLERPSFREFVKKDMIWPLEVELVPIGSLPRNPRTGKLMRVKDVL